LRVGSRKAEGQPDLEVEVPSPGAVVSAGESFERLYRRDLMNVVALAFVLSGRATAARDLAEDGFALAARRWQQRPGQIRPESLVRRLVGQAAFSQPRVLAASVRGRVRSLAGRNASIDVPLPGGAELWHDVRRLGGRQAMAVALYLLEDQPVDGIAEVLGCGPDVARADVRSGLDALAERAGRDLPGLLSAGSSLIRAPADRPGQDPDAPPPPRHRTTTAARCAQVGAICLVATLAILAGVTDSGSRRHHAAVPPTVTAADTEVATTRFVDSLAGGRFAAAHRQLSAPLAAVVDVRALEVQWEHVVRAFGLFRSAGPAQVAAVGNSPSLSVFSVLSLARGQVFLSIEFATDGLIQTFGFQSHPGPDRPRPATDSLLAEATTTVGTLAAGDFASVAGGEDPLARASTTPALLERQWRQLERAYGAFEGAGNPAISEADVFSVNLPVVWARAHTNIIVSFDSVGELDHIVFLRPDAPPGALLGQIVGRDPMAQAMAARAAADLNGGRFAEMASEFDSLGAPGATADRLRQDWTTVTARLGPLRHIDRPALLGSDQAAVAYEIGLRFEHGSAHAQISVDDQHHYQDVILEPGPPTRELGL
jgi:DNA-directed RNA polymerase specialized sigma24 family protein